MKLSPHSYNRFHRTLQEFDVPKEYADTIFNYLVHGLEPGSFFTALLANDAMAAIMHSHPSNTITALKSLVVWLQNHLHGTTCIGSYEDVYNWCRVPENERREILVDAGLVYSEQEEIVLILKGEHTHPVVYWG